MIFNRFFSKLYFSYVYKKQRENIHNYSSFYLKLCATRAIREYLRSKHIYYILRQYHQQENLDFLCSRTCERIIQILIGDEDHTVETDNLLELTIPEHLSEKFHDIDRKEEEEEQQQQSNK